VKKCECGSYAINDYLHGRDGTDSDLCDVCYWRKRAGKSTLDILELLDALKEARTNIALLHERFNLASADNKTLTIINTQLRKHLYEN
jgi:hypothetical protein